MGYTTEFKGSLQFDKPLTESQIAYIQAFNNTRRMKRDATKAETLKDPLRIAVGLPIGEEGAYYVGSHSDGQMGQKDDISVLDHNEPPGTPNRTKGNMDNWAAEYELKKQYIKEGKCQPGLWCQWTVNNDGTELIWDEGEKFYYYTEWIQYLITHFFNVWGVKLNGKIKWQGEDMDDRGIIEVCNSEINSYSLT